MVFDLFIVQAKHPFAIFTPMVIFWVLSLAASCAILNRAQSQKLHVMWPQLSILCVFHPN